MKSPIPIPVLLVVTSCAIGSCELPWAKKVPRATPIRFPKIAFSDGSHANRSQVGKILMVNMDGNFVVIDCGGAMLPESGYALKCFRDGAEVAVITVSSERKGTHVVADIATGSPAKGDTVLQ